MSDPNLTDCTTPCPQNNLDDHIQVNPNVVNNGDAAVDGVEANGGLGDTESSQYVGSDDTSSTLHVLCQNTKLLTKLICLEVPPGLTHLVLMPLLVQTLWWIR